MVGLLKRWDSITSTFHILIGEMTIIVEDIHNLYFLPIYGQQIQHIVDMDDVRLAISYLYGPNKVDMIMYKISLGGIKYL